MIYNFSNIKAGGGIQSSLSFLNFLSRLNFKKNNTLILSKKLNSILSKQKIDLTSFKVITVKNSIHKIFLLTFHNHDKVFTIFGPTYAFKKKGVKWINGFAQAWILFPKNKVYNEINLFNRYFLKIKFKIQEFIFSKSDILIVEHEKIQDLLINLYPNKEIIVAKNSVNQVFKRQRLWEKIEINSSKTKIGIIGNSYIHKNLKILPKIKKKLIEEYGLESDFYVTLNTLEMKKMDDNFNQNINSVGEIPIYKCPSFYQQMDILFFPSNLECFSATPLESVFMQKKIVCADYFFNKYFSSPLIEYFEPNNIDDAAKKIYNHLKKNTTSDAVEKSIFISNEHNAKKRFNIIYNCITNA